MSDEISGSMLVGRVKSYDPDKGYGFIICEEALEKYGRDVYLSRAQFDSLCLPPSLAKGAEVEFAIQLEKTGKPQARHVSLLRTERSMAAEVPATEERMGGERIFVGRVKSFNQAHFYGFLACEETYRMYGRDTFLNFHQADDLREAGGLFPGATVMFTVIIGKRHQQPQASNVLWLDKITREPTLAPLTTEMPPTSLATADPDEWYSDPRRCEFDLNRYAKALHLLQILLPACRREGAERKQAHSILKQTRGMLRCKKCRADELVQGPGVLSLLNEADDRWGDPWHACHGHLLKALDIRLSAPSWKPREVPISKLRFTHQSHSRKFRHGAHAGRSIDWLVRELEMGRIAPEDDSMILNVVLFHGEYRSLNNRHAVALVRYGQIAGSSIDAAPRCFVRVWPLVRSLYIDDGSAQEVARKFLSANDSATDGQSIRSNQMPPTQVHESAHVHVSNIDFAVQEAELLAHIESAGFRQPLSAKISMRPNGRSNGHGRVTFWSTEDARHVVEVGLPQLRGRQLRIKLDVLASAAAETETQPSGGWVRCKQCRSPCASLVDTLLVEDVRLPRDGTPARVFDPKRGYFCIANEGVLVNCDFSPHPGNAIMSFKLKKVQCSECTHEVGNIQDATLMEGNWTETCGEHVVHFKCDNVVLELTDCRSKVLESRKWSILGEALGYHEMNRLSQVTMRQVVEFLDHSSGKDLRLIE